MEIRPKEENVKEISMPQHRMKVEKPKFLYLGQPPVAWVARGNPQSLRGLLCLVTNHLTEGREPFQEGCDSYGTTRISSKNSSSFHSKEKYITIEKRKKT